MTSGAPPLAAADGRPLLADRCRVAEARFTAASPRILEAIRYNDRLAAHWRPGIQTCDLALDAAESSLFRGLCAVLGAAPPPGRPARRPLVLDLGGGTGKVLGWLAGLPAGVADRLTYLYFDISPEMRREAQARFDALRARASRADGVLALADVTQPLFSARDWRSLRRAHHPIIAVCAGGTIGNFGPLADTSGSAQERVFRNWLRRADASLVTFLDPNRIARSLDAYAAFGRQSGLYDGQDVRFFGTGPEPEAGLMVPFDPAGFPAAARAAARLARARRGRPFWVKLDMLKGGAPVGQVTRHYSEAYVRTRFLAGFRIPTPVPVSRAVCMALTNGAGAGH